MTQPGHGGWIPAGPGARCSLGFQFLHSCPTSCCPIILGSWKKNEVAGFVVFTQKLFIGFFRLGKY